MPRASFTMSSTRVERTANSSAAGVYPRRQNETVLVQDKSQWRPSWIDAGFPIGKTDAIARYHLNPKDMHGLSFIMGSYPVKIKGKYQPMPMHNYKEIDVEMRAWEKYGGPERFEEMLNNKAAIFYRRHGRSKSFPKPRTYKLAHNTVPV